MVMDHSKVPILDRLDHFARSNPLSFHVPGHKNGTINPQNARKYFASILPIDLTELPGLDDLHDPAGMIAEAEKLAADYFRSEKTFFLINGSTVGNLAMVMAACSNGDKIIVQRNSHKSVMNGLELSGASPIFISPAFNEETGRYTAPSFATLHQALKENPDVKAVILTYPDYFGTVYPIKEMIDLIHSYHIPVLVDEAHGVHFSIGQPFPPSALMLGADLVVQSAHKMAPAMTMTAFLHVKSTYISSKRMAHFLQMLQSSSPSYPLMASLDIARSFLAGITDEDITCVKDSVNCVREIMQTNEMWQLQPLHENSDFLKITLHVKHFTGYQVARAFEKEGIYPELATHNQILFIHGITVLTETDRIREAVKNVAQRLKKTTNHATIKEIDLFAMPIQKLAFSYQTMNQMKTVYTEIDKSAGHIAAQAIIPYPPGIPIVLKGERITQRHLSVLKELCQQGAMIQQFDVKKGIGILIENT